MELGMCLKKDGSATAESKVSGTDLLHKGLLRKPLRFLSTKLSNTQFYNPEQKSDTKRVRLTN